MIRVNKIGIDTAPLTQHDMTCTPYGRRLFSRRGDF